MMLATLLLSSPWAILPQEPDRLDERLALLEQRIEEARIEHNMPSLGFALVNRDGVIWQGGFGQADLESDRLANENTLYAIGSTTKAFTSALIGDLVDEGLITWDVPIREVVPTWTLQGSDGEVITVRDLLSHRTGYPRMGLLFGSGKVGSKRILEVAANAKPLRGYHETFLYNNVQYLAAGTAAAYIANASWEKLIEVRILDPLGMTSTTSSFPRAVNDSRRAIGYRWDRDDKTHEIMPPRNISNVGPAGSIYSNAADMGHWVQFQLNRGSWNGKQLISTESVQECWKSNIDLSSEVGYGMGWMLRDWQGQRWIEHGGNIDGYSAKVGLLPDSGYGFVMLCNLNTAGLQSRIDPLVWETLLGNLPSDEPAEGKGDRSLDLSPYIGKFIADFPPFNGQALETIDQKGKLAVIVPGQGTFTLKSPDKEGAWAFVLTDTIKMSFQQSEADGVHTMVLNQNGATLEMPREGYEVVGEIPISSLRPYLGKYDFKEVDVEVTALIKNQRLAVDIPGEMIYELHPPDEEGWRTMRAMSFVSVRFTMNDDGTPVKMELRRNESVDHVMPFLRALDSAGPTLTEIYDLLDPAGRGEAYAAWGGYSADLQILIEQAGVTGTVAIATDADDRSVSIANFGEFGKSTSAIGLESGWIDSDFEPFRELDQSDITEVRENSGIAIAIGDFRASYDEIVLEGKSSSRDRDCWVLLGKKEDRPPAKLWFDCENGDLIRIDTNLDLDGAGYLPVRIRFRNYREIEGVNVPFNVEMSNEATGRSILQLKSLRPGEAPNLSAFQNPKAVK
ncbi:MAG: serine hydrolase [Planctomycetes bacterium]|nr:serine hydrolase [Planctomycetota bacterium]